MSGDFKARLAMVSRHVVLYTYHTLRVSCPSYAIILVENEVIQEVVQLDNSEPVEEVMLRYIDWNPLNFENLYISPGMIDFNIRRDNDEWEDPEHLTQAAAAGGVTLVAEEAKLGQCAPSDSTLLYSDLAHIATVDSRDTPTLSQERLRDVLALKAFITPPNCAIQAIEDLGAWLQAVKPLNFPLIVDAADSSGRALYLASPYRLYSKVERQSSDESNETIRVLGGAMNAQADSDSDSEDSAPAPYSTVLMETDERRPAEDRKFSLKEISFSEEFDRRELRPRTLGKAPLRRTKSSLHNIHSALAEKISDSSQRLESLCKAEIMAYQGVGQTRFSSAKPAGQRVGIKRPTPLALTPTKMEAELNNSYIRQLAHYPENMEVKGVEAVISAVQQCNCKVHIANLASAQAVMSVHKAKSEKLDITCETCPHFLFFTDQSIAYGDTRFKNYPPIRDKTNCNFLWELLKVNSIDVVCSQHTPVAEPFKFAPNFRKAMNGINGLGYTLQVLWTVIKKPYTEIGRFEHYIVRMAKWTSMAPAKILKLTNRGSIAKGFLADLVIWDPFVEVRVERTLSKQTYQCPYVYRNLFGCIHKVFVRGHITYTSDGERFYPRGQFVRRPE